MNKRLSFLLLFLCAAAGCLADGYTYDSYYYRRAALFDVLPLKSTDIVMLGNSLIDGCEWHELLQDNRIRNRGITSDVVAGVHDRLHAITSGSPAKVFLLIGINDVSHDIGADSIARAITDVVRCIRRASPSTRVYVQSLLPIDTSKGYSRLVGKDEVICDINRRLEAAAEPCGYRYIDLYSHFTTGDTHKLNPAYTNDGLHLTAEGYLLWGKLLKPYIDE